MIADNDFLACRAYLPLGDELVNWNVAIIIEEVCQLTRGHGGPHLARFANAIGHNFDLEYFVLAFTIAGPGRYDAIYQVDHYIVPLTAEVVA